MDDQVERQIERDRERAEQLPEHERRPEGEVGGGINRSGGTGGEPAPAEIRPIDDQPLPDEPAVDEDTVPPITRSG